MTAVKENQDSQPGQEKEKPVKYLSDYVADAQSKLFLDTGSFFAFSQKQFDEAMVEGVKYVALDAGLICPKENVDRLINGLSEIHKAGIAQDLAENGKTSIIERELWNHEAFYTCSPQNTFDSLSGYDITRDEVNEVYNRLARTL